MLRYHDSQHQTNSTSILIMSTVCNIACINSDLSEGWPVWVRHTRSSSGAIARDTALLRASK